MHELRRVVLALAVATAVTSSRAADFKTGDMVDKETWQNATDLLPPEILKHSYQVRSSRLQPGRPGPIGEIGAQAGGTR